MNPAVNAVAITSSVARKEDDPAVPISTTEQTVSTHDAFEAGATLAYIACPQRRRDALIQSRALRPGAAGIVKHCDGNECHSTGSNYMTCFDRTRLGQPELVITSPNVLDARVARRLHHHRLLSKGQSR
jgi:uncharacterized protein (DUF849 family)